jgi:hypothetical protein
MRRPRKEPTEQQKERARALRAQLLADSNLARLLIEMGEVEAETVNGALVEMYADDENEEFNMFGQWLNLGYVVKKGEHCRYPVWGQPVDREKPGAQVQPGAEGEPETTKFWPMAYLYSNAQVEPKKPK